VQAAVPLLQQLQTTHLVQLQAARLGTLVVLRRLRHPNRLYHQPALANQDLNLPELG